MPYVRLQKRGGSVKTRIDTSSMGFTGIAFVVDLWAATGRPN